MRVVLVLTLMTIVFLGAGAQASSETAPSKAVVAKHAKRIGAVLPKGWSVSTKGSMVTVRRDKAVRGERFWANMSSADKPEIVTWTYCIPLRFAPSMTAEQYHRMKEGNKATQAKLEEMRKKMGHIAHKFDSYIGLTPADKKLVADYNKMRARHHRLPDAFAPDAVVYFEGGYSSSPFSRITDPKVWTECSTVRNKVRGMFTHSPPETQPATSPVPAALNFTVKNIDDKDVALKTYQGKVLLVVNVASRCGYTRQYAGLQALQEKYGGKGLVVMGFPADNFGGQEPGSNAEIKTFCSSKFKVTFPMFAKVSAKGKDQCDFYKYLTDVKKVKASQGEVRWNFEKFLIDRNGLVVKHYRSKIAPQEIATDIEVLLKATPRKQNAQRSTKTTPFSPPSGPARRLVQGPPVRSKFLAAILNPAAELTPRARLPTLATCLKLADPLRNLPKNNSEHLTDAFSVSASQSFSLSRPLSPPIPPLTPACRPVAAP